ncbi:MAG: CerR family C-terminal domain-containing protein [Rhodospirillaceae bacterium]|nr:CerR family C-terminal domain-containing protein [Rhodospirillaceae bacterium]MCA8932193.1 CerR family C-terminal domain-containing protein [Rhodospirillaceae bacterium]
MDREIDPSPPPEAPTDRGDITRQKLLDAAIDVFGRQGYDGTTTRRLAQAAGVNLQAIPYYFGGKEGLYVAAAEHLVVRISAHVAAKRERLRGRIAEADRAGGLSVGEARALLAELADTVVGLFISRDSEAWARFIIREQMAPTEAFRRIQGGVMQPMMEVAGRLVATVLGETPDSPHVRLRTLALFGSILMFRTGRATVLARLGWEEIGPREADAVRALVGELVATLSPGEVVP